MLMEDLQSLPLLSPQIINSAQEGIIVYGPDLRYLLWNPFMEQLSGLNSDDVIGKHPLEVLPFLADVGVIDRLEKVLCGETVPDIEFHYHFPEISKSGWTSDTSSPLFNKAGEIIGVLGIVRDISSQKNIENELKEKAAFLEKLIDCSALSTWISDHEGTVIRVNPACLEFFGASEHEVVGKYNLFKDSVIAQSGNMPTIKRVFVEGIPANITIDYDFKAVDHVNVTNATHKTINSIFTPILDDEGKVSNAIVQTIDLSPIKQAEQELLKTNELLSMFMKHSPIYTYLKQVTPTESRVLLASENFEKMIGIPGSKMVGKTMEELFPAELACKMTTDDWNVVSRNEMLEIEEELNGRIYTSIKFPIQQETRSLLAGYTIDITEKKLAEGNLLKSQQLLTKMGQTSKVGGFEFDIETGFLQWTEEVFHIHEVSLDYVPTVENALDFYSETSKPVIADAVQRAIEHGEPFDLELETITAKDNHRSVHALGVADLENRRVHGVFQDITDRKKTENELQRHKESLDELVAERTEQLNRTIKLMTGREIRMAELKKSLDRLKNQLLAAGITPEIDNNYGGPSGSK